MGAQWSQFFPPHPTFTEANVGSQSGKVFLVTGGASGIGLELVKLLYRKGARVYLAGRSEAKARLAMAEIQADAPAAGSESSGSLDFLHLELDDLRSIKDSVDEFKRRESKLDVLWNNAGVSQPPLGSVSKQGIELQLATNCLGPFLLTQLLLPLLEAAAAESTTAPGAVRVVWTSSQIVELSAPPQGLVMAEIHAPPRDKTRSYVNSKTGNLFLAAELARRQSAPGGKKIVSVALNPGAASTHLFRHTPLLWYVAWPLMHSPVLAAYTQLYAGLSGDVAAEDEERGFCYVVPWGRVSTGLRADLLAATRVEEDGGSGRAREFWGYCAAVTNDYITDGMKGLVAQVNDSIEDEMR
ncbi:hypothetical protein B0T22DRAFT_177731 [Podospora appendiculata]|uniref:NAD(P)-binding protein n=1 Tax=Podospora appendiculata TaxID=314037 RepID=A0AAE0XCE2_9PEZI|nr:hypothetical protein B0T22DRAFT_177731 [Podospora appendiculata]